MATDDDATDGDDSGCVLSSEEVLAFSEAEEGQRFRSSFLGTIAMSSIAVATDIVRGLRDIVIGSSWRGARRGFVKMVLLVFDEWESSARGMGGKFFVLEEEG